MSCVFNPHFLSGVAEEVACGGPAFSSGMLSPVCVMILNPVISTASAYCLGFNGLAVLFLLVFSIQFFYIITCFIYWRSC